MTKLEGPLRSKPSDFIGLRFFLFSINLIESTILSCHPLMYLLELI